MELEIFAIGHAIATRQIGERSNDPLPFAIEEKDAMQLIQLLRAAGKDPLQPRALHRPVTIVLNPVDQAGHHQIRRPHSVLGLLRHGPGQVARSHFRHRQILTPRLLQLQVQQTAQAQAHRNDKQHRRFA